MLGSDHLSREVAAAFALGSAVSPLRLVDRGEQARIWRLDTDRGAYAVKEPLPGFEVRSDGVDVAFQETVLERTDVLLPRPVRRPDGGILADLGGKSLRVATWLDMRPISTDLDPEALGRLVAALHQVEFAIDEEVDPWYSDPVGRPAFEAYAAQLADADAPFAARLSAALPELCALEALLEPPAGLRMCHRDLWANNLRATPGGDLCVIDWDNCGAADPGHELAMVVYEFGYPDPVRCRTVYASYVAAGGPARLTRPGQLTMVIAQFGHFWEIATRRWLDPTTTDAERDHLAEWIAEMEDRPLTVRACERIVDAVAG